MDENKTLDPKLAEALKGIWESLTDEQKEKAKACKTPDELTAFAGREGVELPDDELDKVSGGVNEQMRTIPANEYENKLWASMAEGEVREVGANDVWRRYRRNGNTLVVTGLVCGVLSSWIAICQSGEGVCQNCGMPLARYSSGSCPVCGYPLPM